MENQNNESTLEKAQRELKEFINEKLNSETLQKEELEKAKRNYEKSINEISNKYNLEKLSDKIERFTLIVQLLKGEVSIPYNTNVKKVKPKLPKSPTDRRTNNDKIIDAIKELESATASEIRQYFDAKEIIFNSSVNAATSKLEIDKKILKSEGRPKKYSIA